MDELPLSKNKQLGKVKPDNKIRRANFKRMFCLLQLAYDLKLTENAAWKYLISKDLDHIENVGAHKEGEYDFLNVQLLTHAEHCAKTDTGKYVDYRDEGFKKFLKQFIF